MWTPFRRFFGLDSSSNQPQQPSAAAAATTPSRSAVGGSVSQQPQQQHLQQQQPQQQQQQPPSQQQQQGYRVWQSQEHAPARAPHRDLHLQINDAPVYQSPQQSFRSVATYGDNAGTSRSAGALRLSPQSAGGGGASPRSAGFFFSPVFAAAPPPSLPPAVQLSPLHQQQQQSAQSPAMSEGGDAALEATRRKLHEARYRHNRKMQEKYIEGLLSPVARPNAAADAEIEQNDWPSGNSERPFSLSRASSTGSHNSPQTQSQVQSSQQLRSPPQQLRSPQLQALLSPSLQAQRSPPMQPQQPQQQYQQQRQQQPQQLQSHQQSPVMRPYPEPLVLSPPGASRSFAAANAARAPDAYIRTA